MLFDDMVKMYEYDIYNNSEIEKENIDALSKVIFENNEMDLNIVFDLLKCSNKFCWKNFIRIFESSSYENKLKGIPLMFIFLQDPNWPVYNDAVNFLDKFEPKILEPYIKKYLEDANKDDDDMWIDEIEEFAVKKNINL